MARQLSIPAQAAGMIRQYMRANGIAVSVRSESYSMGSSVNVSVVDMQPAAVADLEAYANQFQYGNFNGMEDIYEYSNSRDDLPQVKFVFVRNEISPELRQSIWDYARGYYAGMENAPINADEASRFYNANFNQYGNVIIYRLFAGGYMQNQYWDFVNGAEEDLAA
jgi:hypothetical protein